MRRIRLLSLQLLACALVAVAAQSCRTPTQVTLDLSTDVACADLKGVDIIVAPGARAAEERALLRYSAASTDACSGGHIGTLVVTPGAGEGAVVIIAGLVNRASSCVPPRYEGCIVARRRFSFIDHVSSTLPVFLAASCIDVPCNETTTCASRKECVDSTATCSADGSCSGPAQAGQDAGPADGAPPDGEGGRPDGPLDDGSVTEAGAEGGAEGGVIPGPFGACPAVNACPLRPLGKPTPCAPPMDAMPIGCCRQLASPTFVCARVDSCTMGLVACCAGQMDCPNGTGCCSSKPTGSTGAIVACGTPSQCASVSGGAVYACSTASNGAPSPECPMNMKCGPLSLGPPEFLRCTP